MARTVAADSAVARRGLTREQYDVLVDAGLLEGQPVELLEGVLTEVVPQGDQHAGLVAELTWLLARGLSEPWRVRVQSPLAASGTSEPGPDLAVVLHSRSGHPTTAALVVEVAVSSHRTDLQHKPRIYAAAGVEQYWVVDVPAREVVVHTLPRSPGDGACDGPGDGPGDGAGYADVVRSPWTARLSVLGVSVVLSELHAP